MYYYEVIVIIGTIFAFLFVNRLLHRDEKRNSDLKSSKEINCRIKEWEKRQKTSNKNTSENSLLEEILYQQYVKHRSIQSTLMETALKMNLKVGIKDLFKYLEPLALKAQARYNKEQQEERMRKQREEEKRRAEKARREKEYRENNEKKRGRKRQQNEEMYIYFSILGIDPTFDKQIIKRAYKRQIRKFHPDLNKEEGAARQFQTVKAAYDHLIKTV